MSAPRIRAMVLGMAAAGVAVAQQVTPPHNPMVGTETRNTGGGVGGGVSIRRQPASPPAEPRKITFVVVSPMREWRDVEDRRIRAALVAFDEEKVPDAREEDEARPRILLRAGKVRLWVEGSKQVSEFPLARLSEEDQRYVRRMVEASKRVQPTAPKDGEE